MNHHVSAIGFFYKPFVGDAVAAKHKAQAVSVRDMNDTHRILTRCDHTRTPGQSGSAHTAFQRLILSIIRKKKN
ncbi:hypothetical protein D1AOALGA4SA_4040 [Olavius algarvensis Delta 1 endosymbiont]|nr:hypothetical protein D1AOALGA4SA_4040 [Olavius algarvensis Delta 1 endosymbiont]